MERLFSSQEDTLASCLAVVESRLSHRRGWVVIPFPSAVEVFERCFVEQGYYYLGHRSSWPPSALVVAS